uniref:Uncharacterized protein n=1 Tax=Lepeophtheirus salmonis TaxID=72036 RepID=A0A0K2THQ2_LEPSM
MLFSATFFYFLHYFYYFYIFLLNLMISTISTIQFFCIILFSQLENTVPTGHQFDNSLLFIKVWPFKSYYAENFMT